ncbi:MAG: DNA repair protein RadA [Gemmatimonadota bacterium]|nr:DNA repair protein RadA [Gemmatimonadota bacterium]
MKRARSGFVCRECGAESLRWEGRCPACAAWNSLAEAPPAVAATARRAPAGPRDPAPLTVPSGGAGRLPVGFGEVDRVLGGGLVPGSLLLLGGAPGVGKSTLLLQAAARLHAAGSGVLYVSAEESHEQVALRARRLGPDAEAVPFLGTRDLREILAAADRVRPALLCVDSIQTMETDAAAGGSGGIAQVRACSAALQEAAKAGGAATVLVGHVTKGGALAGPRTLEHLVDVVLHFEGQRTAEHRILRGGKNRFGSTDELAVFRMGPAGLEPVPDPTALFLEDRPLAASGSAVTVSLHGSRPLLAEVQALTVPARYGSPQRVVTGFPPRRLSILLAVLERRAGLDLSQRDVFLSVVGGLRLVDPAADLAVAAALASAAEDRPLPPALAFAGEVGLAGELRAVARAEARLRAARRSGIETVVLPRRHAEELGTESGARFAGSLREALAGAEGT